MSHRDDGDDSPDVVMDEEDLGIDDIHHQTQDSTNTRDDDSGYSSQHSMENDENEADDVGRILKLISKIIVYKLSIEKTCKKAVDKQIVSATLECSDVIRNDKSDHYDNFQRRIKEQMDRSNPLRNLAEKKHYLFRAFQQLIAKVSENQSWRAFINVVNVVGLVKSVAESSGCFDQELREQLSNEFISFSKRQYSEFINDSGGFEDIVDYLRSIKDYGTSGMPGLTGMAIAASGVAIMGAFLFGRT